jgi:hypothetical protein
VDARQALAYIQWNTTPPSPCSDIQPVLTASTVYRNLSNRSGNYMYHQLKRWQKICIDSFFQSSNIISQNIFVMQTSCVYFEGGPEYNLVCNRPRAAPSGWQTARSNNVVARWLTTSWRNTNVSVSPDTVSIQRASCWLDDNGFGSRLAQRNFCPAQHSEQLWAPPGWFLARQ